MRRITSNATFGLTILLTSFLLLTAIVGLLAYGVQQFMHPPAQPVQPEQIQFAKSSVSVKLAPAINLPPLPTASVEVIVPSTTARSTTVVESTEESNPNVYAADMSAAGIAGSDQPIVQALLFNGPLWKTVGPKGVQVASQGSSAVERFERVTEYVTSRYGSWSAALTQSQNNQGNW